MGSGKECVRLTVRKVGKEGVSETCTGHLIGVVLSRRVGRDTPTWYRNLFVTVEERFERQEATETGS